METKQVICVSHVCCGQIFHMGVVPDSYDCKEFMKDLKMYAKHPDKYKIETLNLGEAKFGNKCECKKVKVPELF